MKLLTILGILTLVSCSSSVVRDLDYSRYNLYSSSISGNMKYLEIGPVFAEQSGSILTSCNKLAETALAQLAANAKSKGGNAVINVRWKKDEYMSSSPNCDSHYGWAAIYGVGLFLPWVNNIEVSGIAAKIKEENLKTPPSHVFYLNNEKIYVYNKDFKNIKRLE
ncbi:hypothetical protein ACRXCV_07460 [Halobacteriovorax sp. GFR7]|uniref:hypothetical protein n=1 Tax=unclassified Halobacteriovorax TaxID=2639665 RepID=UPI003D9812E4